MILNPDMFLLAQSNVVIYAASLVIVLLLIGCLLAYLASRRRSKTSRDAGARSESNTTSGPTSTSAEATIVAREYKVPDWAVNRRLPPRKRSSQFTDADDEVMATDEDAASVRASWQLRKLHQEQVALQLEMDQQRQRIEQQNQQIDDLTDQRKRLLERAETAESHVGQLRRLLGEHEATIASIEREKDSLTTRLDELEANSTSGEMLEEVGPLLAGGEDEQHELEMGQLQDRISKLEADRQEAIRRCDDANAQLKESRRLSRQQAESLSAKQLENEELRRQVRALDQEKTNLKEQVGQLGDQVQSLATSGGQHSNLAAAFEQSQAKLVELTAARDQANTAFAREEQRVFTLRQELNQLTALNEQLQRQLQQATTRIEALSKVGLNLDADDETAAAQGVDVDTGESQNGLPAFEEARASKDCGAQLTLDAAGMEQTADSPSSKPTQPPSAVDSTKVANPGSQSQGDAASQIFLADDLKRIDGIGPVIEEKLQRLGIHTFQQIADWDTDAVERFAEELSIGSRIQTEDWVGQAQKLVQVE